MLWMCICMSPYHISLPRVDRFVPRSLIPPEGSYHSVLVWQLRLYTHPRWLPHQCQTCKRWFSTIICCGCAYEWVLTTLQLLSSATSFGYLELWIPLRGQDTVLWCVGEAIDPFKMPPTPMSNIWKLFQKVKLLWMCIWMSPYHAIPALVDQAFGGFPESGSLPGVRPQRSELVKAINLFNMAPTSLWNIQKVFYNHHILWMCISMKKNCALNWSRIFQTCSSFFSTRVEQRPEP